MIKEAQYISKVKIDEIGALHELVYKNVEVSPIKEALGFRVAERASLFGRRSESPKAYAAFART